MCNIFKFELKTTPCPPTHLPLKIVLCIVLILLINLRNQQQQTTTPKKNSNIQFIFCNETKLILEKGSEKKEEEMNNKLEINE